MVGLNKGQSLMELLIAVGVGVIIILAGATAVGVYLRVASQDATYQRATFLAQELVDKVVVTAEGDWQKIANVTAGNHYLTATAGGFTVNDGSETVTVDISYARYFSVAAVCRDGNDAIGACGTDDPSTKKVTVTVDWQFRGSAATISIERYITHTNNAVFWQTDWVGGATCPGSDISVVGYNTRFCNASADVDFTSAPGSIKILGL